MIHCSCDCDAPTLSTIEGRATLRIVLSMEMTVSERQSVRRVHHRRRWISSGVQVVAMVRLRDRGGAPAPTGSVGTKCFPPVMFTSLQHIEGVTMCARDDR